jgi:hypothetical protein
MSATTAIASRHTYTLSDDLESLFYVLICTVLRYFLTNVSEEYVPCVLQGIFGSPGRGMAKKLYLLQGTIHEAHRLGARKKGGGRNVPLTTLVNAIQRLFVPRYTMVKVKDQRERVPENPIIDHDAFLALLKTAIDSLEWPTTDEEQWFDRIPYSAQQGFDYGPMCPNIASANASEDQNVDVEETGKRRRRQSTRVNDNAKKRTKIAA